MGWRDVQAKVQSGELDYSPDDDSFGRAFASAADIIAKKWISDADAAKAAKLEEEKEAKAERKRLEQERKEAEKKDQEARDSAKTALTMARIPWSQKAENSAYQMIKGGSPIQSVIDFLNKGVSEGFITYDLPGQQGPMPAVTQTNNIFNKYESGSGGADALLSQAQNTHFKGVQVSKMKIGDVLNFQRQRGPGSYHAWSKANMPKGTEAYEKGLGSTPVGIFQFVGDTMQYLKDSGAWNDLGINDDTIFSEEVQKKLFVRLAQERLKGKSTPRERIDAMKGTWEGLKKASDSEVLGVIKAVETGTFDEEIDVEVEGPRTGMEGGFMIEPAGETAVDVRPFIEAIEKPGDLAKQLALIDADPKLKGSAKEEAKRAVREYATSLPAAQVSDAELAEMDLDDLQGMAALLKQQISAAPQGQAPDKTVLLQRIETVIGAKGEEFDIADFDDTDNPTIQTMIDDKNTNPDDRKLLEALLANRGTEAPKLQQGSPSFITTYDVVDEDGNKVGEEVTTTMLTTEGSHIDISTGKVVEPNKQPQNRDELREIGADFARINTAKIKPLKEARTNMVLSIQSAKKLADIVQRNPNVQTVVGGKGSKFLKNIGLEIEATDDLLFGGVNEGEFGRQIEKLLSESEIAKNAGDAALYTAELYKFAFVYASSRLGQSGQGLSNKDFVKALEIVAAGKGDTFIKNIKSQTKEIVQIADNAIADFAEEGDVMILDTLDTSGNLLKGYKQTTEEFANNRGFGDAYAFVMSEETPQQQTSEKPPKPTSLQGVPRVRTEEERNALPNNTWYVDPTGTLRIKE